MFKSVKSIFVTILMIGGLMTGFCVVEAAVDPLSGIELPEEAEQVVLVEVQEGETKALVSAWQKVNGQWQEPFMPVEAVIGRNGLAPYGEKEEGDGRTPSGVFALHRAFGYEKQVTTGLDYRQATKKDFWIDDSTSVDYNQWVSGQVPAVSHEVLRREDDLYKYVIVMEYNTNPVVTDKGSAIFMHIWRQANQPTAGCVAMAEEDILKFLVWLKKEKSPVVFLVNKDAVNNYDN